MAADLNTSMFRAYDIRTPSAALTPDLAARLARAEAKYFGDVLGTSGVVIAHDARSTGPQYLSIACEEFLAAGLDVLWAPGVSSTCLLYFAAMCHPEYAAIMFGASHNPPGDTGQKILAPGVAPVAEGIGPEGGLCAIQALYEADARVTSTRRGKLRAIDPLPDYMAYSMERAGVAPGSLSGTRVLQDYLYGAAGREMTLALDQAGVDLTPLHFAADGTFPLGAPNPVKEDVTAEGRAALASGDFLCGMFFDGDGDRLDVYRGDGTYLSSSFVYAAILPHIKAQFLGEGLSVFADLKANPLAIIEMARCGVNVRVVRNGHSQIKHTLMEDPTTIGAVEESAHFYEAFTKDGGRYCTENALYHALLTVRAWREDPTRFGELSRLQSTVAREREWGYRFDSNQARSDALSAVEERLAAQGLCAMQEMDTGMDLEATLMRRGLPFQIGADTALADDWLQVCHRISQSEDGLARWEVVGGCEATVGAAKADIAEVVRRFGAGEEYQG